MGQNLGICEQRFTPCIVELVWKRCHLSLRTLIVSYVDQPLCLDVLHMLSKAEEFCNIVPVFISIEKWGTITVVNKFCEVAVTYNFLLQKVSTGHPSRAS